MTKSSTERFAHAFQEQWDAHVEERGPGADADPDEFVLGVVKAALAESGLTLVMSDTDVARKALLRFHERTEAPSGARGIAQSEIDLGHALGALITQIDESGMAS